MNLFLTPDAITSFVVSLILAVVLLILIGAVLFGIGFLGLLWMKSKGRESDSLNTTLLQVALPRDNEVKIDAAEQLFSSLVSIGKDSGFMKHKMGPHLSFEIVGAPGDIRFYVNVPNKLRDFVEKQINGAYPEAEIVPVYDPAARPRENSIVGTEYNIFQQEGKVAFASLILEEEGFKPIKVYKDFATDPLSSMTSVLAKMSEGEGAVIQFLVKPADGDWKKEGKHHVSETKKHEANPETAKYDADPKELDSIENKVSKPGFETVIRIVVSSSTKEAADAHLDNIVNAFSQYSGANSFHKDHFRMKSLFMTDFIYRYWPLWKHTSILNSEELSTLYHFPNKSIATPGLHTITSKRAPAPARIPTSGLYLGRSTYRGLSRPVYVQRDDRRRHMYIIGKTGTGKTEFLKQMIMQDINAGEGLAVVDPHGDLIEDILKLMPPSRAEDVILFDPSDTSRPMGFNMLDASTEEQKHFVVNSIIGLMYKLFDPNKTGIIGPRFEHAIRNAMLTVMYEKGSTFIEVVRVLTDANFVQELLPKVEDPIIKRYWTDQIAQTSDFHKSEVLDYIVSKFGRFVTNKMIRNIIGQSDSAFNFRKVMDEGKILLVKHL